MGLWQGYCSQPLLLNGPSGLGWAGLGVSQPCCRVYWARAPAPAEGPAVLQAPELGLAWPGCHRCRGGVEARDTVCSHSVLAWVSLCFRIRGFLVTAVQPPVTSPGPRLVSTLELVGGCQCRQLAGRVRLHDCRDYLYTSPVSEYWPLVLQKVASEGS